jgi:uncharacterized protein YdeI (YjbR/CyaY-like superfamily)
MDLLVVLVVGERLQTQTHKEQAARAIRLLYRQVKEIMAELPMVVQILVAVEVVELVPLEETLHRLLAQ